MCDQTATVGSFKVASVGLSIKKKSICAVHITATDGMMKLLPVSLTPPAPRVTPPRNIRSLERSAIHTYVTDRA